MSLKLKKIIKNDNKKSYFKFKVRMIETNISILLNLTQQR